MLNKKIILTVLAAILLVTLPACGKKNDSFVPDDNAPTPRPGTVMRIQPQVTVAAELLGKTGEEINAAVEAGTGVADQVKAAGKFEEFKTRLVQDMKDRQETMIEMGRMDKETIEAALAEYEDAMKAWDGTGDMPRFQMGMGQAYGGAQGGERPQGGQRPQGGRPQRQ